MIWDTVVKQRPAPVLKALLTPMKREERKSVMETPKWSKLFSGCTVSYGSCHTLDPAMQQASSVNAGSSLRSAGANPLYGLGTFWTELRARAQPRQGNGNWFVPRLRERRRFMGPRKRCGQHRRVTVQLEEPALTRSLWLEMSYKGLSAQGPDLWNPQLVPADSYTPEITPRAMQQSEDSRLEWTSLAGIPAPPLMRCVTSGKGLTASIYWDVLWWLNEHLARCLAHNITCYYYPERVNRTRKIP